ncbi:hypothetical protein C0995_014360 [Termitomyces sp. Mi166|nr:hypothetical protein C0995_014360 [Termitomyces sp. Mi166\
MGNKAFYGPSMTVDTTKKFTVVTQFLFSDPPSTNPTLTDLMEIRRLYVQDGVVIQNSKTSISGMPVGAYDSISEYFCDDQKAAFGDRTQFQAKGGLTQMGTALEKGMVLVLSIWDDHTANMLWLDSSYPVDANASTPGVARGSCPTDSGDPGDVENQYPDASVTFSNIRVGDLGSTF